jgi:hypothetical protein
MKGFALKHPNISGFVVFLTILVIGCSLGWLLLFWIMSSSKPISPTDPNDGAAMAAGMILNFSIIISFISAIVGGFGSTKWLKSRKKP